MKKFKVLLTAVFMLLSLCACGRQENKLPETHNTGFYNLTDRQIVQLDDIVSNLTINDFISDARTDRFTAAGFIMQLADVVRIDYDTVFYRLVLIDAAGKTVALDSTAKLFYQYDMHSNDSFNVMDIIRGNITVENDRIIHTTLDGISVYDANTLKKEKISFDLSFIPQDDFVLLDTITTHSGYVTAYFSQGEQGFAFFDADGNFVENHIFRYNAQGYNGDYFGSRMEEFLQYKYGFNLPYSINPVSVLAFTDETQSKLVALYNNEYDGLMYDLEHGTAYQLYIANQNQWTDPAQTLQLFSCVPFPAYREHAAQDLMVAVSHIQSAGVDVLVYKDKNMDSLSVFRQNTTYDYGTNSYTVAIDEVAMDMVVDFDNDTVRIDYNLTDSHLGKIISTSEDGRYSLYVVTDTGFGQTTMAVKDNTTGKISFLGERGVLYQTSYGQFGFMANGDVYHLTDTDYEIYSNGENGFEMKFSLNDHMPFGNYINSDVETRYLSAVLRDKQSGRYYVAYYETPYLSAREDRYLDGDKFILAYPYKIAVADSNGNIISTYETDVNVYEIKHPVALSLNGDVLYISVYNQNTKAVVADDVLQLDTGIHIRK